MPKHPQGSDLQGFTLFLLTELQKCGFSLAVGAETASLDVINPFKTVFSRFHSLQGMNICTHPHRLTDPYRPGRSDIVHALR